MIVDYTKKSYNLPKYRDSNIIDLVYLALSAR